MVSKELSVSSGTCQKADLISAKVNILALLIFLSKQSLNSRNWVFRAFQCSVQRSAVYTSLMSFLAEGLFTMVGALTHALGSVTFSRIP